MHQRRKKRINQRQKIWGGVDYTTIGRDRKQKLLSEVNTMGTELFCDLCHKQLPKETPLDKVMVGDTEIGEACLTCSSALKTILTKQFAEADAAFRAAVTTPPPDAPAPAAPPPKELKPVDAPGAEPPPLPPK